MLTTDDISDLFEAMRTSYGQQWKHGPPAVRVWRNALSQHSTERVQWAANEALKHYVDHPPTLPQFLSLLRTKEQRPGTYLPAPAVSKVVTKANRWLIRVLCDCPVDSFTLNNLVDLKNALAEEFLRDNDDWPTEAFELDVERQLMDLARNHDREARARETEAARRRQFGTMVGFAP